MSSLCNYTKQNVYIFIAVVCMATYFGYLAANLTGIGKFNVDTIKMTSMQKMGTKRVRVEFEVFGKVQGVFFRKYTQEKSKALGLKGWCMNTESGTVQGVIEGSNDKISEMKKWLETTGSPKSKITKAEFKNEQEIKAWSFDDFKIKRN